MKYTAEQIKNMGGKRFIKKRAKRIGLLLILSIAWIPLVKWLMIKPNIIIVIAPIVVVGLNIVWGYVQSRTLFYRRVKENPELLD